MGKDGGTRNYWEQQQQHASIYAPAGGSLKALLQMTVENTMRTHSMHRASAMFGRRSRPATNDGLSVIYCGCCQAHFRLRPECLVAFSKQVWMVEW